MNSAGTVSQNDVKENSGDIPVDNLSAQENLNYNYDLLVKCALVGDVGTGKSTLVSRYVKNDQFVGSHSSPTVGVEFTTQCCEAKNGNIIKYQLWDASGHPRYRSMLNKFFESSVVVILVYSVDNRESFESLQMWYDFIKSQENNENVLFAVVGNKSDLKDSQVIEKEAREFAEKCGALFCTVSAVTGKGVEKLFKMIANHIENLKGLSQKGKARNSVEDAGGCCHSKNSKQCNVCIVM